MKFIYWKGSSAAVGGARIWVVAGAVVAGVVGVVVIARTVTVVVAAAVAAHRAAITVTYQVTHMCYTGTELTHKPTEFTHKGQYTKLTTKQPFRKSLQRYQCTWAGDQPFPISCIWGSWLSTLAHGAYIGVNLGPMLGMVLNNRYHLMTRILHWKLLAKRHIREKMCFRF